MTALWLAHHANREDFADPGCPLASLTRVSGSNDNWSITLRNDTSRLVNGARAAERLV